MKYKKGLIFICLLICLFAIASVCAGDVNESMVASNDQNDELIKIEDSRSVEIGVEDNTTCDIVGIDDDDVDVDENLLDEEEDSLGTCDEMGVFSQADENDDSLALEEDKDLLGASPPYTKYNLRVYDTTINRLDGGSVMVYITPCTGYSYSYDFYFRVYDSNNNQIINKNYYSYSSATSITHTFEANSLQPGTYTIKLVNYADSKVMATAKLTVNGPNYSVRVYDTTMNYGSSGTVKMYITPASSGYYKYNFYFRVYDSNNNQKISKNYYSTSSATSITHTIAANSLQPGIYTINLVNYGDNLVMATAKLTVKNLLLETSNIVGNCDEIIEYKVRACNGAKFTSGLSINVVCNGKSYTIYTDNDGYATLNLHLKAGTYDVTTKFAGITNKNTIKINSVYVANKYKNVKIKVKSSYYKQNRKITYSFKGNLKGYFKIYKGKSLKYNKKINTNGYIDDYFEYKKHSYSYAMNKLKETGKYTVKIVDGKGKVIAKSTFSIKKASTKTSCYTCTIKVGSKKSFKACINDKSPSRKNIGGFVKFKINGKTYKVKVKNGVAIVKNVKFPKKVKTYYCSVKYLGDKNHKSSSRNFKVNVRKYNSVMGVYSSVTRVGAKNTIHAWVAVQNFDGYCSGANSGTVKFTIAGKTYYSRVKNGAAEITITAPSRANTYYGKAIYLGTDSIKGCSDIIKMVVNNPPSPYDYITSDTHRNYFTYKYSGRYTVKTIIFDMWRPSHGHYKYIDTWLYKDGYLLDQGKYIIKYKVHGKWTGWKSAGPGTNHHRYPVFTSNLNSAEVQVRVHK